MANLPPSNGTSGLRSGGRTGKTFKIIHSGLFPDFNNDSANFNLLERRFSLIWDAVAPISSTILFKRSSSFRSLPIFPEIILPSLDIGSWPEINKKLPDFLKRREEIFQYYKKAGLDLLDVPEEKNGILEPVRFRAILKTENPRHVIKSLDSIDVRAIVPTEDWELLGPQTSFPNGLKLSRETVSLPIYPSLTNEDLDHVLSGIVKK